MNVAFDRHGSDVWRSTAVKRTSMAASPRTVLLAGRTRRCALLAPTLLALATINVQPARAEEKEPVLTLTVAVAAVTLEGERVVDDAWVDAQWAAVDRLYASFGIRFDRRWVPPLPDTSARLETKEDRDAL